MKNPTYRIIWPHTSIWQTRVHTAKGYSELEGMNQFASILTYRNQSNKVLSAINDATDFT